MQNQNTQNTPVLPESISARINKLPPCLSINQLADFLQKKTPTIRKQIERCSFPVTIRQIEGGEQYVLLSDLIRFVIDGIPQPQPPIVKRAGRNPFGRSGKRGVGRPSNASRTQAQQQQGGAK